MTDHQREAWLEFISQLYEAALEPQHWPRIMDRFVELLGAGGALIQTVDPIHGDNDCTLGSHFYRDPENRPLVEAYLQEIWQGERILYDKIFQSPHTGFVTDHHCLGHADARQLENHAPAQWIRENLGFYYRAASRLHLGPGISELISIQYPAERPHPITPRELPLADRCLPHFARLLELSRLLQLLCASHRAFLDGLDSQGVGVLVLDAQGRPAHANRRGKGLLTDPERARLHSPQLAQAARRALQVCRGESWDHAPQLRMERAGRKPLLVKLYCLGDRSGQMDLRPLGLLILVIDPEDLPLLDVTPLARHYRLSPAETDVCRYLCKGLSRAEIAEARKVSQETIRSQIKRLFRKTGCNDRHQLLFEVARMQLPLA